MNFHHAVIIGRYNKVKIKNGGKTDEELEKYSPEIGTMNFYALPDDRFAEFAEKCGAELLPAESSAADMVDAVVVQTGRYTSNNYRIEGMNAEKFLRF